MKVSLGPVLYYWNREQLMSFYARAAESAVDVIYVGETVCSKRRALRTDEWIDLAHDLARDCGKEVLLSSLTLIEAESELGTVRRQVRELSREGKVHIEANDFGAVQAAREAGLPFVAGQALNIYNSGTLVHLARLGARRWIAPVELSRDAIGDVVAATRRDGLAIETEVFGWGRLPLAHSARCFTARAFNLPKDQCGFRCADTLDGMPLATREGAPLFRINGIQTQSANPVNLFSEVTDMRRRGIDLLRISPSTPDDWPMIDRLSAHAHGDAGASVPLVEADACNGYWFGRAGMEHLVV